MAFKAISPVGAMLFKAFNTTATQSVTPSAIGNCWVVGAGATTTLTGVSGGSATNWTRLAGPNTNTGGTPLVNFELWIGTITSTSTANITIAATGSPSYGAYIKQFTCAGVNSSITWGTDGGNTQDNPTSSLNVTFPTLVCAGANRCYAGMCIVGSDVATTGQPAGYTVERDPTFFNAIMFNETVTDTVSPVLKQTSSNDSYDVGSLIYAQAPDRGSFFPFF